MHFTVLAIMLRNISITMLVWMIISSSLFAQDFEDRVGYEDQDSLRMSILTCAPGPEVYALYGHMAIRYQNRKNGADFVFNYGSFNMNAPLFIPKFTLGIMDYELGCQPFSYFYQHYSYDGCDITQQELNLTPEEKKHFLDALLENYLPENRGYRYDFIYDNCATRPRDILEKIVDGEIVYLPDSTIVSYRQMLHVFNGQWPWSKLGVDLALGAKADKPRGAREQEWIPYYLQSHFAVAQIKDANGKLRPLVKNTVVYPAERPIDMSEEFPLEPMTCSLLLLGFAFLVSLWEYKKKKIALCWDGFVFATQGITGLVLFVLFFLSAHPCTGSNWLILLFHPIPLVFLIRILRRGYLQRKDNYHVVSGLVLTFFMAFFCLIPQDIPLETLPLALVLLLRHLSHFVLCKK